MHASSPFLSSLFPIQCRVLVAASQHLITLALCMHRRQSERKLTRVLRNADELLLKAEKRLDFLDYFSEQQSFQPEHQKEASRGTARPGTQPSRARVDTTEQLMQHFDTMAQDSEVGMGVIKAGQVFDSRGAGCRTFMRKSA